MKIKGMPCEDKPVAVYDVSEKKLVLVAKSQAVCGRYCFGSINATTSLQGKVGSCIRDKSRSKKNNFKRLICFRTAKPEQSALLEGKEVVILDERFNK